MNPARRYAKGRKPTLRWSQRTRPVLVRRKDVTPEEFAALWNDRKFPPKLLQAREEPFRCGTPMLRAAEFVGPPRPSLESRYRGYPLTSWKRKRLHNSHSIRWFRRKLEQSKRVSLTDTLRMWLPQSATV